MERRIAWERKGLQLGQDEFVTLGEPRPGHHHPPSNGGTKQTDRESNQKRIAPDSVHPLGVSTRDRAGRCFEDALDADVGATKHQAEPHRRPPCLSRCPTARSAPFPCSAGA